VKVNLGIWSRLTQVVIALIAIALLLLVFIKCLPLIQQNERMRRDIDRLDAEVDQQKQISQQLQMQLNALTSDPKTIERLAREKLGYARPDETVVRFETNSPAH
jgi:cell division protein FtsB